MQYKKIHSFTGFRFFMILIIVFSHFMFPDELKNQKYLYSVIETTFAVDFFFMISGFGMMLGNLNRIPQEKLKCPSLLDNLKYGIDHIKKIYPLYIGIMLFVICFDVFRFIYLQDNLLNVLIHEIPKLLVNITLMQSLTGMLFFTQQEIIFF